MHLQFPCYSSDWWEGSLARLHTNCIEPFSFDKLQEVLIAGPDTGLNDSNGHIVELFHPGSWTKVFEWVNVHTALPTKQLLYAFDWLPAMTRVAMTKLASKLPGVKF